MRTLLKSLAFGLGLAAAGMAAQAQTTLTVGAYAANPPWEVKQTDGTFEGFEVDLVNEIARRMDAEVQFEDMGFQALFAATSSQRIDMAISSITITNERLQSQSFTQAYYDADLALASNRTSGITSLEDMRGKVVAVLSSSTGDIWAQANKEAMGFTEVRGYNNQQDMILDTQLGRADGAISDITGMEFAFQSMPQMHVVERIPSGDKYAIMMTKDHPLLQQVSDTISAIKEDGTMLEFYKKWFGADSEPGPSTTTAMGLPPYE
jgi:polar amino acid transport system substrate-binding protein